MNLSFRNAIKLLLAGLALFVGMGLSPATAAADTTGDSAVVQVAKAPAAVQAVESAKIPWDVWCSWSWNSKRVDYQCTVRAGYVRVWADCIGWGRVYTGWVGVGQHHLWVDCGSYTLGSFGRNFSD
ncbi:hypothetical protein JOF56_001128 [Kibdelosporangium banguiense]|uniref:Uncharacterized protein n=1 Tax=Kibdelosporangium banguiense TaxID=1365924 RepID=A0ABS4T8M8_9PSEU|nr:hypothetical protein [Kibdelosporangium banguiense]MBP2320743.1 hypothetical protein [Kibdelosporangium banguiense]